MIRTLQSLRFSEIGIYSNNLRFILIRQYLNDKGFDFIEKEERENLKTKLQELGLVHAYAVIKFVCGGDVPNNFEYQLVFVSCEIGVCWILVNIPANDVNFDHPLLLAVL